ncbi:ATPase [Planctomycetales bacterium]|nr:ATPase [Planctomycetales bacterium]
MKRRSIRVKIWADLGILILLVFILAGAGFYAVRLYTNQVRDVAWRVNVLPVAGHLSTFVSDMQTVLGELRGIKRTRVRFDPPFGNEYRPILEAKFSKLLADVKRTYEEYRQLLEERVQEIGVEDNFAQEFATIHEIRRAVQTLETDIAQTDWGTTDKGLEAVEAELLTLQQLTDKLPNYLHEELKGYSQTMKRRESWLNGIVLLSVIVSIFLALLLIRHSFLWIFKPLRTLIDGSRKVAAGTFQYRITLQSQDEMAELADAMNQMTERFEEKVQQLEESRHDLDQKVQQRSRELVRSERLASVGFLAAGVAHEINNPLMAISTCAESLQRRILPLFSQEEPASGEAAFAERYLKMIQDEAFRCKGITEKLLSIARNEPKERTKTDLVPIIVDMVEMTRQHTAFKRKNVSLELPESLEITVNSQEMKQVVLNLVTNAFQSTSEDGHVVVRLEQKGDHAFLYVQDDGVGMDEAVLKNIFEPFFSRRKQGQGTGLGLSITHRIIEDHRGRIEAFSGGEGKGTMFVVELPLFSP